MIITRKGDRIQIEFAAKDLGVEDLDSPLTREEMDEAIDLYDRMRHPRTKRDLFLAMTDEELAKFMSDDLCELLGCPDACDGHCDKKLVEWLKEEVKE